MNNIFNFTIKKLYFKEIDFNFQDFNFSYPLKTDHFVKLIEEGKPFYPPLLYKGERKYLIVDGLARVSALKKKGLEPFSALNLENSLTMKDLFLFSLELNLPRGLNLVEKALFFEKGKKYFSRDELLELLPRLGFSKNPNWFFYFEKIVNLEEPFKNLLAEEKLNPKIVESLSQLSQEEREEFLTLVERLRLTFNEQRDILEILLDYKKLQQASKLLPEEIEKRLYIEDFNQRRKEVFEIINQLKYPYYYEKKKLADKLKSLFSQRGIKVDFPPYFEKREISVQFNVKNVEELKKIIKFMEDEGEKLFSLFE